jgi:hypothetical protein
VVFQFRGRNFGEVIVGRTGFYQAGGTSNWNNIYQGKTAEEEQEGQTERETRRKRGKKKGRVRCTRQRNRRKNWEKERVNLYIIE